MAEINTKIIYPEETSLVIAEIIKKYGLKGINEDFFEGFEKDEPWVITETVFVNLITNIAEGKTLIQEVPSSLQKNLNISEDTAKKITEEIKTKIISLVKKVPKEESEIIEEKSETSKIEQPATIKSARLIKEPIIKKELSSEIKSPEQKKTKTVKKSPVFKTEKIEPTKQKYKKDSYRESTE